MIVLLTIAKTVKTVKITEQNHSQNCPDCIGPASAICIGIKQASISARRRLGMDLGDIGLAGLCKALGINPQSWKQDGSLSSSSVSL